MSETFPPTNETDSYVDGSVMNGSAGAGVFSESDKTELSIPLGTFSSRELLS